jgi:hypothetical protein
LIFTPSAAVGGAVGSAVGVGLGLSVGLGLGVGLGLMGNGLAAAMLVEGSLVWPTA